MADGDGGWLFGLDEGGGGANGRPTEVVRVGRTGLVSSQLVTGFSGGMDMP